MKNPPTPLQIISKGTDAWNAWREKHSDAKPTLTYATLDNIDLSHANLTYANLSFASLVGANLTLADLRFANLSNANLNGANLSSADLRFANFSEARLEESELSGAIVDQTRFGNNDLSTTQGLRTVRHLGPSTIGIDTLYKSEGKIPNKFLSEAGIPDDFLTFVPSLVAPAIQFYSCFISYSHQDETFSQRLHSRMRSENLRVWYAPEDMKGGKKLHEEIFRAIQIHDKLLLVLSENSMKSEWVTTEIRRARKVEREENRRKLFPIRLVDGEQFKNGNASMLRVRKTSPWSCANITFRTSQTGRIMMLLK